MKNAIISLLGAFATILGNIGYASSSVAVPEISEDYRMTVDGAAVDVYRVPTPEPSGGGIEDKSEWHPYSYAPFVATGAVEVCVKSGVFDLSKTQILPKSKGVVAITQSVDTVRFRMTPPMTLVLEPKGRHRALVVSAAETQVKKSGEGEERGKVMSFGPGFHRAGEIKLGDGDTLYLAPGAWVEGWIKAKGKDITVCGSGVLSGACWKWGEGPRDATDKKLAEYLALISGENITVKDVTFFSSWGWTLVFNSVTNALVDNVKVIGGRVINDDGIDICRAKDVVIRNSFVRCQDDCITPKWWCENFVCTNLTLWTDAANVFRTGYECESGASGLVYRNHLIKDIDILHLSLNRRPATNYWANNAICIQPSHGQRMSDLVYEDLRFHECGPGDLFLNVKTMPITQGLDFKEAGTLTNLVLRNIHLPDSQGGMSVYLSAHDDAHPIEGVIFENVTGYGPVTTNGKVQLDTAETVFETAQIQGEIDAAAAKGGGRVTIAAGVHPCGTIHLKSGVELHLEKGAVLQGGARSEDYEDIITREGLYPEKSKKVLIVAEDAHDIAITGEGVIDGQGPKFFDTSTLMWGKFWEKPKSPRPRLVQFARCERVRLEGVTFKDSPNWTMWLRFCNDVSVSRIRIVANQMIVNSDGIDFDACRHVRVGDSFFHTGDDCLILRALRGPDGVPVESVDTVVSNCVLESACQGVRIGCPSDDLIRDAVFRDIVFRGDNAIASHHPYHYLKKGSSGYVKTENLRFENWQIASDGYPVWLLVEPGIGVRGLGGFTFRNFQVNSKKPFTIHGCAESVIRGVRLENITGTIAAPNPFDIFAVEDLAFDNFRVTSGKGPSTPLKPATGDSWETGAVQ